MTTFAEFIAAHPALTLAVTFQGLHAVPAHGPQGKPWDHFAWECTLTYEGRTLTTPYRCGVGHCELKDRRSLGESAEIKRARAAGVKPIGGQHAIAAVRAKRPYGARLSIVDLEGTIVYPLPPSQDGLLYSLQSDAQAGEFLLFEDFASEFGYDTDSRAAEKVWRACQETRGRLQKLFGADFAAFMACVEE